MLPDATIQSKARVYIKQTLHLDDSIVNPIAGGIVGSAATLALAWTYRRWKRIPNADAMRPEVIRKRKWIKGVVTR